mmetsp:Transcript_2616/g.4077  ORF Transcript_2616/g.4077 Transcript_2616/m.4077 type:complete len:572 (-) Transcript_2616:155-1870(-)
MSKSFHGAVLVAVMPMFLFGYSTGVLNAPESVMFPSHTLGQWSTAVSSFCIGGIVGANVSGKLADKYGRRQCLLWFTGYLNTVAGLLHVITPNMTGLIIARIMVGLAGGTSTVVTPVYLGEIAPPHIKGSIGTMTQLSMVLGIMASVLVALPFCTESQWRFIFVPLPVLSLVFVMCVPFLLPESPKWLLLNHYVSRGQEAKDTLKRFRAGGDSYDASDIIEQEVELSLSGILQESSTRNLDGVFQDTDDDDDDGVWLAGEYDSDDPDSNNHDNNNPIHPHTGSSTVVSSTAPNDDSTVRSFLLLRSNRIAFTSSILFPIAQQLSGINALFYYSTTFFEGVIDNPQNGTILAFFVNVLATILALMLMDRCGRKTLLSWSAGGMLGCCILLTWVRVTTANEDGEVLLNNDNGGIDGRQREEDVVSSSSSKYLIVLAVMLYITFFEIGLGSIPFFLASELIPSQFLGRVQSISFSANWTCNFLVGMLFPYMDKYLGAYSFVPFGVMLFGTALYAICILPETRGKSLDDVMRELRGDSHERVDSNSNSMNNNNNDDEAIALTPSYENESSSPSIL